MEDWKLGEIYQDITDKEIRKSIGQYYTPEYIIKYILEKTIGNIDVVDNPFLSVIDISCGAGYFLLLAYDILKNMFSLNIEKLRKRYKKEVYIVEEYGEIKKIRGKEYWVEENIHYHILKNCLYGADNDGFAVDLTIKGLQQKEPDYKIERLNIIKCDSLVKWERKHKYNDISKEENRIIDFWSKKYDFVVGNPPYIGHKQLSMEYKQWLLQEYKSVFRDKADISFCFFQRILEILSPKGIAGIITSRYFTENPTGKQLRTYLVEKSDILEIVDFYGADIFKGVGVATGIYFFTAKKNDSNKIKINKLIDDKYRFDASIDLKNIIRSNNFESFEIEQKLLEPNRWIFVPEESYNIYRKIESKTKYSLKDIALTFQGVITGYDKAFVLTDRDIEENKIEKDLLKKWVKNKNIQRYEILDSDLFLIYSDHVEEVYYPNSLNYIGRHRTRLENRRECRNGFRKWYELQWGRDSKLFEQTKIVFPYKARENRFAIDYNNIYCSADVYSLIIKEEFKDIISLEYLVGLLNSKIYEFYFKLFAKKMGKGIYDYYPNSVLDLKIITEDIIEDIKNNVIKIIELKGIFDEEDEYRIKIEIIKLEREIDRIIGDYFGLREEDLKLIDKYILLWR